MEQELAQLRIDVSGEVARVALAGEIDDSNVDELSATLGELFGLHLRRIELDLAAVDYLGSAGVRALVRAVDNTGGVDVAVVAASDIVVRVLEITGLSPRLLALAGDQR
jgi:anti-anti-sigma factor